MSRTDTPPATTATAPRRTRTALLWTLQVAVALALIVSGGRKLVGTPDMLAVFDQVGVGQWFRIVTGLLEIGGAVLLLTPRWALAGAAVLGMVMAGAVASHAFTLVGGPAAPALVLLALVALIAWLRRAEARPLLHAARPRARVDP